jgi:signal transduction histidine kinase
LINDVLDMAKVESGHIELHPEPYSFAAFDDYIRAVIQPLCQEKGQQLIVDILPYEGVIPLVRYAAYEPDLFQSCFQMR